MVRRDACASNSAYFDAEFPHERNQFISDAATNWATMALARVAKPPPAAIIALRGLPRTSDTFIKGANINSKEF